MAPSTTDALAASSLNNASTPELTEPMWTPSELTDSFVTDNPSKSAKLKRAAFPVLEARYGTVLRQCRTVSTDTPVRVRI